MADIKQTIQELEAQRYQAMLEGDLSVLDKLLDDELVYTHSFGDRDSKVSYLKKLSEGFFDYHRIDYSLEAILLRGDSVTLVGRMDASATVGGADRHLNNCYTAVWGKIEGEDWKFIAFQPTPIINKTSS